MFMGYYPATSLHAPFDYNISQPVVFGNGLINFCSPEVPKRTFFSGPKRISILSPTRCQILWGFFFLNKKRGTKPHLKWRTEWDSNPRYPLGVHTISNRAPSASRSSVHCPKAITKKIF